MGYNSAKLLMVFPRVLSHALWILEGSIWEKVIQRSLIIVQDFGKDFKICILNVGRTLRGELYPLCQQTGQ